MRLRLLYCITAFLLTNSISSQAPKKNTPSETYHAIQKLNFLGTALYIAAHPDDENTRLISYLSNEVKARTGYLSLTRGDGGQNIIGPELRELLGVLRTQELLKARSVDGGEQFFSRANDFGYSKHPDETLKIWNKEEILGDVVRTIRTFKPDIIINRFDHRSPGTTHGHHTSSAMLSVEAFDLANDKNSYSQQLQTTETWQPQRLFFNTSWWFYGSEEKFKKADKSNMLNVDIGVYYPMLGISNNEIAAIASSQHLCQGFGRLSQRGSTQEYVELLKGDLSKNRNDLFDGINTTWSRIDGGKEIGAILNQVEKDFNFKNPAAHIPELVKAYSLLQNSKDEHWKTLKSIELRSIIKDLAGLHFEAFTTTPNTNPGATVDVSIEIINRSNSPMLLKKASLQENVDAHENIILEENVKIDLKSKLRIPENTKYTNPYWLNEKGSLGMYTVKNEAYLGKPETPRAFIATYIIDFNGSEITFTKPVVFKHAKRDKGELFQPFEVVPEATASFKDKVLIFADNKAKQVGVTIKAHQNNVNGKVQLCFDKSWKVDQETKAFNIAKKGDEQIIYFRISPPENENESFISPILKVNGKEISKELVTIAYDHIPTQTILLPSEAKVVRLNIKKAGENIGYIMGAGDKVPNSLEQIGYTVHTIDPSAITKGSLQKYDAVVVGIRAYNVVEELKFKQPFLLDYVENGGNLIVQYNTAGRWGKQFENLAPYALEISRDRVTDENSEVKILEKHHSLINFPNSISKNDFNGWVQERGLYFPNKWDSKFTPILQMKDEGESAKKGSLLVAPYGKGNYIYTGLSFFRELPAGVPGAYKLFSNMISIGKDNIESNIKVKG
ncbi:PIG-L family deacetylase [uncultured Maribacter sp.]|uniref:PIG-L family deacetylase n=1 Tax=uncultured Maribacter sp. TaxID=431308 RepID=UPI00261BDCA1|nr:PIG-L family deacetylase [uncultured Maribacter sp.]